MGAAVTSAVAARAARSAGSLAALPVGAYTVCEVEIAYMAGQPDVPLDAVPRPESGNGGSTGGGQTVTSAECIMVDLTAGTAELKFLDTVRAVPTPTSTSTSTPTGTSTATSTPVTPTVMAGTETPANTPTSTVPSTSTPTPPIDQETETPAATATGTVGAATNTPFAPTLPDTGTGPRVGTDTPVVWVVVAMLVLFGLTSLTSGLRRKPGA